MFDPTDEYTTDELLLELSELRRRRNQVEGEIDALGQEMVQLDCDIQDIESLLDAQ